jgi:hypothetical protein
MSRSYSLAKAQSCQTFDQNLVLLFIFSFSADKFNNEVASFIFLILFSFFVFLQLKC